MSMDEADSSKQQAGSPAVMPTRDPSLSPVSQRDTLSLDRFKTHFLSEHTMPLDKRGTPIIQAQYKGSANPWLYHQAAQMASLSTNTVTVPSTSHLERPISSISSSTTVPLQFYHSAFGPSKAFLNQGDAVTLKRRSNRMAPNPKRADSVGLKVTELRYCYVERYLTGTEASKREISNDLISQDAPLNKKYKELDFEGLVKKNMVPYRITNQLVQALGILEKYASNLIKQNRPTVWRTVKFTSSLWKTYLENMNGSVDILKQMGYTNVLKDGLCFPDDVLKPNVERVKELAADLYLAKVETDELINDRHPYFVIEKLVPDQKKMEASSAMGISNPTLTNMKNPHTRVVSEMSMSEESDSDEYEDAKEHLPNDATIAPQPGCYICGEKQGEWSCNDCKTNFCQTCDPVFHKHHERQHHIRIKIGKETSTVKSNLKKTGDMASSPELRNYENVDLTTKLFHKRLEDDGNRIKKPPIPTPRKRVPSRTSSVSSMGTIKSTGNLQTGPISGDASNPEQSTPPFYGRNIPSASYNVNKVVETGTGIKEKVPQQPTDQVDRREILRPPVVTQYEPVKEPLRLILENRDEQTYQSLHDPAPHIYETLEDIHGKETPPPLPARPSETTTVPVVKSGAVSCPHCYCLNGADATHCVACNTLLREPSLFEGKSRHVEQNVINAPWRQSQKEVQTSQRRPAPSVPKPIDNPIYFSSPSASPTARVEAEKAIKTSSPGQTDKPTVPQWQCEHCTTWNPLDKRICEMCAKTRSDNAKVSNPDPVPSLPPSATKLQEEELKKHNETMTKPSGFHAVISMQEKEEQLIKEKRQRASQSISTQQEVPSFSSSSLNNSSLFQQPSSGYPSVFASSEGEKKEIVSPRESKENLVESSREKKEIRESGELFIKMLKKAEPLGFTPEEVNIAFNLSIDDHLGPINWLQTEWYDRIHKVMVHFANVSKDENIGNVSPEEARQALIEHTGDVQRAVEQCITDRKKGLKEVMDSGFYLRTDCISALDKNDGNVNESIQQLQIMAFEPLLERIRESCLSDDADDNDLLQQRQFPNRQFPNRQFPNRQFPNRQISTSQEEELFEALVSNKELDMDRRIRVMFAEHNFISWGRATTAIKLIDRNFPVNDSIEAAKAVGDLPRALEFLQRECSLCYELKPENQMVTMLNCQCRCCRDCLSQHVKIVIHEQNIMRLVCPMCGEPNLDDDTVATEYFNNLDIMIRLVVDEETHNLFQRKLRDRTLMKEPNFRWCSHCSSGFINEQPQLIKMACPSCRKYTCFKCKKQWEDQHEGISCEQFAAWKEANDPEAQANGLAAHLKQNGIECPQCKFRYDLAKGGCMHFKCNQCTHEFCSGCYKPFKQGNHCTVSPNCARRGLHAHHPRDCLFYLRDRDPVELKKLLDDNNIPYDTEPPPGQVEGAVNQAYQEEEEVQGAAAPVHAGRCKVMEQREAEAGLQDVECGRETPNGFAGLCRLHFTEYLVERINTSLIDPVSMYKTVDLQVLIQRNDEELPAKKAREKDKAYRERLAQFVKDRLPLPKMPPRRRVLNTEEEPQAGGDQIPLLLNEELQDGPLIIEPLLNFNEGFDVEDYSGGESDDNLIVSDTDDEDLGSFG